MDGVTSECGQVTSPANLPNLFRSTAMLMAGMQQVKKVTCVLVQFGEHARNLCDNGCIEKSCFHWTV